MMLEYGQSHGIRVSKIEARNNDSKHNKVSSSDKSISFRRISCIDSVDRVADLRWPLVLFVTQNE